MNGQRNWGTTVSEDFKLSMRHLAGAVNIITAGTGPSAAGLTATAVCSLSMTPPRLLVCLNRAGATYAALAADERFCVNVLGVDAQRLAETFAGRTGLAGAQKFADAGWVNDNDQPPRLEQALSAIHCTVHSIQIVGTHAVVIGDVAGVHNCLTSRPLIYQDQAFQTLQMLA